MDERKYTNPAGKSITFGKDFRLTFEEFVECYESTHIFRDIKPKERELELKKAFAIATAKDKK